MKAPSDGSSTVEYASATVTVAAVCIRSGKTVDVVLCATALNESYPITSRRKRAPAIPVDGGRSTGVENYLFCTVPAGTRIALRSVRIRGRIVLGLRPVLRQQRHRRVAPARCRAFRRQRADRVLLDLRGLRRARERADRRGSRARSGQSLRTHEARCRARIGGLQSGLRSALGSPAAATLTARSVRATIPKPISSPGLSSPPWCTSMRSPFSATTTRPRTAPPYATTSTSPTSRMRT